MKELGNESTSSSRLQMAGSCHMATGKKHNGHRKPCNYRRPQSRASLFIRATLVSFTLLHHCSFATHGPGARRQIASGEVGEDPASNQWVRNGVLLGAGGYPADRSYWENRMNLYDNYGNYRLSSEYLTGGKGGTGFAKNAIALKYTYENTGGGNMDILNADTEANFWQGQDLDDGMFAASVPGKPWIRQSLPFTCKDNPYNECKKDKAECIAEGCEKGIKVGLACVVTVCLYAIALVPLWHQTLLDDIVCDLLSEIIFVDILMQVYCRYHWFCGCDKCF
jgi:hypothetical protein